MKISVITVCLNAAAYLAETLQSVAEQEDVVLEHLLIDGGSKDGSIAVVQDFAERNPALRWWSEPDQGIGDAMNRGIERATGDWVAFLHADDCYAGPQALSIMCQSLAAQPRAVWLTAGIEEIDAAGRVLRRLSVRSFSPRRLMRNNIFFHPATLVRLDVLRSLGGFDTSLRFAMDYDLWLRLVQLAPPVLLDQIVARFRVHAGSLSTSRNIEALEEEYRIRCRYLPGRGAKLLHGAYQCLRLARARCLRG